MTKEEKELLTRVLCEQLPYGVQVEIEGYHNGILKGIDGDTVSTDRGINYPLKFVKPYLRPLSSMTEEAQYQLGKLMGAASYNMLKGEWSSLEDLLEFVNKNHIDVFGLTPKGLAIAAVGDDNPYKEKGGEE